MSIKLVGSGDETSGDTVGANYFVWRKFTAEASGSMVEFRIKMQGNGNIKAAIYSDSGGEPDALLASVGSTACTTGWNTIAFTSTAIVSGTVYWLCINQETISTAGIVASGAVSRYLSSAYTNAFPDPAGSLSSATWGIIAAGWGITSNILKVSGVAYASISKISGVAIASVKKVAGLA